MKDLFDKTFFRFTIGFVLIIAASFAIMAFSGYYQDNINASVAGQGGEAHLRVLDWLTLRASWALVAQPPAAADLSAQQGLPGWRQGSHLLRQFKKLRTRLQRLKRSTAKDEKKRQAREEEIRQACRDYLDRAGQLLERLQDTRQALAELPAIPLSSPRLTGS